MHIDRRDKLVQEGIERQEEKKELRDVTKTNAEESSQEVRVVESLVEFKGSITRYRKATQRGLIIDGKFNFISLEKGLRKYKCMEGSPAAPCTVIIKKESNKYWQAGQHNHC